MKRFFLVFIFLLVSVPCFADRMTIPPMIGWGTIRDMYVHPMFTELYNALGANESGELPGTVTLDGLIVLGDGDSWVQLANNTTITDPITGLYLYTFLGGDPTVALNGTLKRLALYEELAAGDPSVIQANDPTLASATGKYYSRASGGYFNVVHGVEMFAIAGTRTADETAPIIVAGADSTHDGSTPVTATMVLTELYPDPSTLLYTVTGGTPASGTWAGTYPNYSLEVTPTGTDSVVVTSSGSDLAGNVATGTDLVQEFAYSGGANYDDILFYWGAENSSTADKPIGLTAAYQSLSYQVSPKLAGSYSATYTNDYYDQCKWVNTADAILNRAEGRVWGWVNSGPSFTDDGTYFEAYYDADNYFQIRNSGTSGGVEVSWNGGETETQVIVAAALTANSPTFVEVAWNSSGIKIYLDGEEKTPTSVYGTFAAMSATPVDGTIRIGAGYSGCSPIGVSYDQWGISNDSTRDGYAIRTVTNLE